MLSTDIPSKSSPCRILAVVSASSLSLNGPTVNTVPSPVPVLEMSLPQASLMAEISVSGRDVPYPFRIIRYGRSWLCAVRLFCGPF